MRISIPRPAAAALGLVALAGCSSRELTRHPEPPPGTGTWLVVWTAIALAAVALGAMVAWPALRHRRGAVPAAVVMGLEAGLLAVIGAIGIGAAIRSEQLIRRPPDELPEVALLELSSIGDSSFANLILAGVAIFLALPAVVLGVGARLAASEDRPRRWVACGILGLQATISSALLTWFVLAGTSGRAAAVPAVGLVVAAAALTSCWPRPAGAAHPSGFVTAAARPTGRGRPVPPPRQEPQPPPARSGAGEPRWP